MRFDSYRAVIWGTGLWLYIIIVLYVGEIFDDISPFFIALTYLPIIALYLLMLKRENEKLSKSQLAALKPQGLLKIRQRQMTVGDLIESFLVVFGAVILGMLTIAFIVKPEMGLRITNTLGITNITCTTDTSRVVTVPVNKTIKANKTTITVHNVTYNVPQKSEYPVEFGDAYHCSKATLIEVTIDRPEATQNELSRKLYLQNTSNTPITSRYYALDEYDNYISSKNLTVLNGQDFTHKDDAYQERGWLVFRLTEDYANTNNTLVYSVQGDEASDTQKVSVELLSPEDK